MEVAVLDVNETLTDLTPLADLFARLGAPGMLAGRWLHATLENGFALSMAGSPKPFRDVAAAILPSLLHGEHLTEPVAQATERLMDGFNHLRMHSDAAEGIAGLRENGLRVATLTNGSVAYTRELLRRHDLGDAVDLMLSVEDAPAWKPDPRAYQFALDRIGADPLRTIMIAVHPWDLFGARQAGLRTGWIDRSGSPYPDLGAAPDLAAESLPALAAMLV